MLGTVQSTERGGLTRCRDRCWLQGCVLAPDLINLFLDTAVQSLPPVLSSLGVKISYRIDCQLRECKNPTHIELVWISMYADDICLIADDAHNLRQAIMAMDAAFLSYGLTGACRQLAHSHSWH